MSMFGNHKKSKRRRYHKAYNVNPSFFSGKNGETIGAFALREETLAAIPKEPASLYKVGDTEVKKWRLVMLSLSENTVGEMDYFKGIAALRKYIIDETDERILIRELTLKQMLKVLKKAHRRKK